MNRAQAGILVVLVLLVAAPLGIVGADVANAGTGTSTKTAVEADTVEFRITVYENASARWTFTYTRILENETQRQRFEAFAEEFEENETNAYRQFRDQARALAASGRNATGREMSATDFTRSAGLGGNCVTTQDCGTIRMSFSWSGFADRSDEQLVVGDVFDSGLFLSSNQQLVFETGPGLAFESASPEDFTPSGPALEESDSITYEGGQSFSDQRPRVVIESDDDAGNGNDPGNDAPDTSSPTDETDPGNPNDERGLPMALIGGLIVVVVGAGAAIVWWRGEGTGVMAVGGDGDGGATGAQGSGDLGDDRSVADEELLTDEDRVLTLLQDNGGRMKQVHIVDETGWSKSKVSMLLSEMEDDDQISKLRVGRENIISLSGHEPEAAGSPHEED